MREERDRAIEAHRARGHEFTADGLRSFATDVGSGETVLMMHGVPASSFLYRKVSSELARRDHRAVSFDLPGMGFADRPLDRDYSWTGLGRFSIAAVDALKLDSFHLVVHDIGGPVGFELAAAYPERVRSLTILNTLIAVDGFVKPWVMRPFGIRGLGELWLATLNDWTLLPLMYMIGIKDRSATPRAEIAAYAQLLKRADRGRAFLKVMRGFEPTAEKERLYVDTLQKADYPIQIIWAKDDPALGVKTKGAATRRLLPGAEYHELPGKHFFQEEQPAAIAELISGIVARSTTDATSNQRNG